MDRNTMYGIERDLKNALQSLDPVAENNAVKSLNDFQSKCEELNYRYPEINHHIEKTFISNEVINATTKLSSNNESNEVEVHVPEFKKYVENLLDVDLSHVEIMRYPGNFNLAEGKAIPCAINEHLIIIPPKNQGFVAHDILLHELGHTAEFTLRRQITDDSYLQNFGILSEAIAHFCQFRHMREFATPTERLSAIASVAPGYVLLKMVQASYDDEDANGKIDPDIILGKPEIEDVRSAMGRDRFWGFMQSYRGVPMEMIYHHLVVERMGAIIALHLIDNPEAVRKLCTVAPLDTLEETLDSIGIDTQVVLDFSKADELIKVFLQ